MNYVIGFLIVFLLNIIVSDVLKKEFVITLPITLMGTSLLVYLFGFFRHFSYGYYFIGFLVILYVLYKLKNRSFNYKLVFNTGTIIIVILYVFLFVISHNKGFNSWDDYMHWGSMLKYNIMYDRFYCLDSNFIFAHKDYPPIMSIYLMIMCFINGGYSEGIAIFATQFLQLAIFISILGSIKNNIKKLIWGIVLIIVICLVPICLPDIGSFFYSSLYTDALVGILFGYSLFNAVANNNRFNLVSLSISLSFLIMLKQIGLAFVGLVIMAFVVKLAFNYKKVNKKSIVQLIFIIAIPIMFYGSWKILISNMNTDNTLINQFSYSNLRIFDIFAVLKGIKGETWQIETARSFLTALKTKVIFYQPMQLGYVQSLFLINIILIIIVLFTNKKCTKKSLIILLIYDVGAIGYAFGMLMLYVFAFGPYEGPILASFERYMQTYILSGILISIFEIYSFEFKFAGKFKYLLCLLWIIFVPVNDYYKLAPCNEYTSWGDGLRPLMENIANNVTINDKVLIIENNVQTINHYIMGYYLMPITIDVVDDGYDVIAGDRFCMEISETQLQEKIKNSDYLYIDSINDKLIEQIKSITNYEVEVYHLYKIENDMNLSIVY